MNTCIKKILVAFESCHFFFKSNDKYTIHDIKFIITILKCICTTFLLTFSPSHNFSMSVYL